MKRPAVLALLILAAAAPPASAKVLTEGAGADLVFDGAGAAHIAFVTPGPDDEPISYCKVDSRGAPACAPKVLLADGGRAGGSGPAIGRSGLGMFVVASRSDRTIDPPEGRVFTTTAIGTSDRGETWGAPFDTAIGGAWFDAAFNGGDGSLLTTGDSPTALFAQRSSFNGAIAPEPPATARAALGAGSGSSAQVDFWDSATPVVVTQSDKTTTFVRATGDGDLNDNQQWSAPAAVGGRLEELGQSLVAGTRGLFLSGVRELSGGSGVRVLRFGGKGFKTTATIRPDKRQQIDRTAQAQGASRIVVAWHDMRSQSIWASASVRGSTWSKPKRLARDAGRSVDALRAAVAPSGKGMVLWEDEGKINAVRLDAIALAKRR